MSCEIRAFNLAINPGHMEVNFLKISKRTVAYRIPFPHIVSVSSVKMISVIHTLNGEKHICCRNAGSLFEDLSVSQEFFRPHRSFIVNLTQIKEYNRNRQTLLMSNGNIIPVSRRNRPEFMRVYFAKTDPRSDLQANLTVLQSGSTFFG